MPILNTGLFNFLFENNNSYNNNNTNYMYVASNNNSSYSSPSSYGGNGGNVSYNGVSGLSNGGGFGTVGCKVSGLYS